MTQNKYDYNFLLNICKINNIELANDYSKEKINYMSKINFKCISCKDKIIEKSFRIFVKSKIYKCSDCSKKYNYQYLLEFCEINNIILLKDYQKEEICNSIQIETKCKNCKIENISKTFEYLDKYLNFNCIKCSAISKRTKTKQTFLEKYGTEHHMKTKESKEKIKKTNIEKYGVEYVCQNEKIKEKIKEKFNKNYGCDHPLKNKDIQNKIKKTNIEKYGVENVMSLKESVEKFKKTCLEKYGHEHALQSNVFKEKFKKTCLQKYGVSHPMLLNETKEKIKKTCIEKYNVENVMQNPEISEKNSINTLHNKNYIFSSGKIIKIQGYEHFALDELLKNYNENDIFTGIKNVPEIWYEVDGKYKRHFVDIFIPKENKCIEIKSLWTLQKRNDNVFRKQKAGKYLGFNYEIWIYDSKGNKIIYYE